MAVALRSQSHLGYGSHTNPTVTAPAGIANGDVLLMVAATLNLSSATVPIVPVPPAGWTAAPGTTGGRLGTLTSWSGGNLCGAIFAWTKVASSEGSSYAITQAAGSSDYWIGDYTGVDTTTPLPSGWTFNSATGPTGSITALSVTPTVNGSRVVIVDMDNGDNSGTVPVPTGTTPTFTQEIASSVVLDVMDGTLATAAATGDKPYTSNSATGQPRMCSMLVLNASAGATPVSLTPVASAAGAVSAQALSAPAGLVLGATGEKTQATVAIGTSAQVGLAVSASASAGAAPAGVSDNFNRADGVLGGSSNWVSFAGLAGDASLQIVSNVAKGTVSLGGTNWYGDYRSEAFANDQYAQFDIAAQPTSAEWIGCAVRVHSNGGSAYRLIYFNNNGSYELRIGWRDSGGTAAGTYTTFVIGATPYPVGTTLKLAVVGNTLTAYQNGVPVTTATDTVFTSGAPGLIAFVSAGGGAMDNFAGGSGIGPSSGALLSAPSLLTLGVGGAASAVAAVTTSLVPFLSASAGANSFASNMTQVAMPLALAAGANAAALVTVTGTAITFLSPLSGSVSSAQALATAIAALAPSAGSRAQASALLLVDAQFVFSAESHAEADAGMMLLPQLAPAAGARSIAAALVQEISPLVPSAGSSSLVAVEVLGKTKWFLEPLLGSASSAEVFTVALLVNPPSSPLSVEIASNRMTVDLEDPTTRVVLESNRTTVDVS